MSLVEHARRELALLGEESAYAESLINAIDAFASYGHSGGSAMIGVQMLNKLLNFENLTPLTSDTDEWVDRSEMSSRPLWQAVRNPRAFSEDGGATYYLLDEEPRQIHEAVRFEAVEA